MDKGSPGMESLQRLESLEKEQSGPWFLCPKCVNFPFTEEVNLLLEKL